MHKRLIIEAFKKAEKERKEKGDNKPSTIHMAEDLSEFVKSVENFSLGERSYRDYLRGAEVLLDDIEDININQLKVVNGLCKYLGYESYIDFKDKNSTLIENKKTVEKKAKNSSLSRLSVFVKKNKVVLVLIIVALTLLTVTIINKINEQRWMVWDRDHYIEVKFDTKKYDLGQLKLYNEDRIEFFRKVLLNCDSTFFNEKGNPIIWYGKNNIGELELFTSEGLHPETGKTLKPISQYMINKYVCND